MPALISCHYRCPKCKAVIRDHGHEGAAFTDMQCPNDGTLMEKSYREVDPAGKRVIHRPHYEAERAEKSARQSQ